MQDKSNERKNGQDKGERDGGVRREGRGSKRAQPPPSLDGYSGG